MSEEFKPGERITEARLTSEYGVARPTAKACLERLVVVGLLRRTAHKSAVVPVMSSADVRDLFLSRLTIEGASVRLLAQTTGVPRESLHAHREMEAANEAGSFADSVQADVTFHRSLVRGTASGRLVRMHDLIMGEVELTMGISAAHQQTSREDIASEHGFILDAILSKEPQRAEDALREHLENARVRVLASIEGRARRSQEPAL